MAVPPPLGDIKIVSTISTFVLNTLTLKYSASFFFFFFHQDAFFQSPGNCRALKAVACFQSLLSRLNVLEALESIQFQVSNKFTKDLNYGLGNDKVPDFSKLNRDHRTVEKIDF